MMPTIRLILLVLSWSSLQLTAEILAEYQQPANKDSHLVRLPALSIPQDKPATPLLNPGPFGVTWSGTIEIEKRQRLNFSFEGSGSAVLTLNGKETHKEYGTLGETQSALVRLEAGSYPFTVSYQSPDKGPARFQLFWQERAFPREPIPPSSFGKVDPALAQSQLVYQGRELFARHLCSKCHLPKEGFGPDALPELTHVPPILALTGDRLQPNWLAEWLYDPSSFRPDTNMPSLLPKTEAGRQQAADLAAYLMTLKTNAEPSPLQGSAQDGGVIFHNLACITCHGLPNDVQPSEGRLPLAHLNRKFQPHALRDFLLNPSQLSPHTRMPDFRLSEEEASNLTSYLLTASAESKQAHTFPQGDVSKGTALANENHCGACHAGLPYDTAALPPFESIVQKSWQTAPCYQSDSSHLNLPDKAGEALEALRSQHLDSLRRDTPASFADRQIRNLRCHACHSEDDQSALLASLHYDSASLVLHLQEQARREAKEKAKKRAKKEGKQEGKKEAKEEPKIKPKVSQKLPALTDTGAKLHTSALTEILQGNPDARARPWLDARMPSFKNFAPETLATGLAARHGLAPSQPKESQTTPELIQIGEDLLGSRKGFSCTACHALQDAPPTTPWEVKGINFNLSRQRLRQSFYHRWVHDPTRIDPTSRMPRYADQDGETALPVLNNDSQQQFQAIWQYLQTLEN